MKMKKAQAHKFWIQLIIAAIVILVFMSLFYILKEGAKDIVDERTCRESIEANARGHIRGITIDSEINCPTNLEPIKSENEEEKKKELAERMKECWGKFKEGKNELFAGNRIYCSICDVIEFEDKDKITGFQDYLVKTNIPGKDISYADYFSGYETPKAKDVIKNLDLSQIKAMQTSEIDGDKRYAVIFVYAKGKDEIEKVTRHITAQTTMGKAGLIVGAGTGVAAGATVGITVFLLGSNPIGWAVGATVVVGGAVNALFYFLSSDNHPEWASFILLKEYNAQNLKEINCQEIK